MRYLLLLFIIMPILEIGVLIRVGGWLGLWPTLLIVVLTAVLGTWMLRQQSAATMMQAQSRLAAGELPAQQIFEGLLLLVGGILLLTPGFVTDAFGFTCLMPWSRRWLATQLANRTKNGTIFMSGGTVGGGFSTGQAPNRAGNPFGGVDPLGGAGPQVRRKPSGNDAIEGEYREVD